MNKLAPHTLCNNVGQPHHTKFQDRRFHTLDRNHCDRLRVLNKLHGRQQCQHNLVYQYHYDRPDKRQIHRMACMRPHKLDQSIDNDIQGMPNNRCSTREQGESGAFSLLSVEEYPKERSVREKINNFVLIHSKTMRVPIDFIRLNKL